MSERFLLVALLVGCIAGGAVAQQQEPRRAEAPNGRNLDIPKRIEFDEPRPYWESIPWLAASEVADAANFTIDKNFLQFSVIAGFIDKIKEAHDAGIGFMNGTNPDPPGIVHISGNPGIPVVRPGGPLSGFQELVESSSFIAVGTVRESVAGFAYGEPGRMLVVQIEQWRGRTEQQHPDEVLLFWPGGAIEVGYATIFSTLDGVPLPPNVGEKVALFPEFSREARSARFIDFLESRYSFLGAAAKFGPDGRMHVSDELARQVPSIARMHSSAAFSSALEVAIARSAKR